MKAEQIVRRALELGYDRCGIVPVERMAGYEEKLEQRMERFPQTRSHYQGFRSFARPQRQFPWAKSVVVCCYWDGKYEIPQHLQGIVAKHYLTDSRRDENAPAYQTSLAFEGFLRDQGLQTATERKFGVTALRWAAMEAGIGIIRRNNFFYTEKGSYYHLEAFLIDRPLEWIEQSRAKPCAPGCNLCVQACPTGALAGPYAMCRNDCVSCLTTWDGWDLRQEPLRDRLGTWMYGCDACQDACPHNRNSHQGKEPFPGLDQLAQRLTYRQIVRADYDWLETVLQPKLWYIPQGKEWRYKVNALNAMLNNFTPEYLPDIQAACQDEKPQVRQMAQWALEQLEAQSSGK